MNGMPLFPHSSLPCQVKYLWKTMPTGTEHWAGRCWGSSVAGSGDGKWCASDELIFTVFRPRGGVNLHLGNVRSSQRSPNGLFAFQQRGSGKCVARVGSVESEKKRLFPCAIWDKRDAVIAERMEGRMQALAIRDALHRLSREPEPGSKRQQDVWSDFSLLELRCPCSCKDRSYQEPTLPPRAQAASRTSICPGIFLHKWEINHSPYIGIYTYSHMCIYTE